MAIEVAEEVEPIITVPYSKHDAPSRPMSPEEALRRADPAVLAHVVSRSRAAGNEAFKHNRFRGATLINCKRVRNPYLWIVPIHLSLSHINLADWTWDIVMHAFHLCKFVMHSG